MVSASDWQVWAVPTSHSFYGESAFQLPTPSAVSCETVWNDAGSCMIEWPAGTWTGTRGYRGIGTGWGVIVYRLGAVAWTGQLSRWTATLSTGAMSASGAGLLAHVDKSPSNVDRDWNTADRQWIATELVRLGLDPRADVQPSSIPFTRAYTVTSNARCILAARGETYGSRLRQWVSEDGIMVVVPNLTLDPTTLAAGITCSVWDARGSGVSTLWNVEPGRGLIEAVTAADFGAFSSVLTGDGSGGVSAEYTGGVGSTHSTIPSWATRSYPNVWSDPPLSDVVVGAFADAAAQSGQMLLTVDPDISGKPHPTNGYPGIGDTVACGALTGGINRRIKAVRWQVGPDGEVLQWQVG